MGIVTTTSERVFTQSPETVYDFVTNPENWPITYPSSTHVGKRPPLPLKVGDTWQESGRDAARVYTWHCAIAMRPKMFVFNSVGLLGHDHEGNGGIEARMTVSYHFSVPAEGGGTLFSRTMTVEAYRHNPLPDDFFRTVNPAHIDQYQEAIARELDKAEAQG
jgi:hypothetical protein